MVEEIEEVRVLTFFLHDQFCVQVLVLTKFFCMTNCESKSESSPIFFCLTNYLKKNLLAKNAQTFVVRQAPRDDKDLFCNHEQSFECHLPPGLLYAFLFCMVLSI